MSPTNWVVPVLVLVFNVVIPSSWLAKLPSGYSRAGICVKLIPGRFAFLIFSIVATDRLEPAVPN